MNRRIASLALTGAMVFSLMGTSAFAADVEDISEPAAVSEETEDISPRTSIGQTLAFNYAGQEKVLFNDNNWLNAKVIVENYASNPGSITVRIVAYTSSGNSVNIGNPFTIPKGGTGTSAMILASYASYTVYVKAATAGTYTIRCHDISV